MCLRSIDKFALCALFCGAFTSGAFAYPSNPVLRTVDNDGDSLSIRTIGDEHYRFTQTEDGFLVSRDSNGVYFFVNEDGERSKVKAKNAGGRTASDKAFLNGLDRQKVHGKHREKHPDRYKRPETKEKAKRASWVPTAKSPATESATTESATAEDVPPVMRLPKAYAHANGTNRFPVFMVGNYSAKNADSAKTYAYMSQENYRANGYIGSIRDYFADQSGGLFVPTFDLYFLEINESFTNYIGQEDRFIVKAFEALWAKYPDFNASLYDSDNDGDVDAFAVLYAGEQAEVGDKHLGGFQYELRWNSCGKQNAGNGKRFNNYFILNQVGDIFERFIHEFSHTMGLRDHYCVWSDSCYSDYTNKKVQAPGAHAWDVMATGMYNGQNSPPNYSGFERNFMGWLDYTTLKDDLEKKTLPPLGSDNYAYYVKVTNDEWYVLENRQKVGWDAALPNHGMLVWHIDYNRTVWENDALNDDASHQRVDVVEAGNLHVTGYYDGFASSGGRHLVDDPFPGSLKVTELAPLAAWNGYQLLSGLYNITEQDSAVCFSVVKDVVVENCGLVRSSSSSAEESSSSESSSSVASSSSAATWPWRSSSSVAESSSSASERIVSGSVLRMEFGVHFEGGMLNVFAPVLGTKTVRIFDLQGHLLLSESFDGSSHGVDLRKMPNARLVVRVDTDSRSLGYGVVSAK